MTKEPEAVANPANTSDAQPAAEVSRHPEASIPTTELSLADIERSRAHPVRWVVNTLVVLVAIIAPYWFGRMLASNHTEWVIAHLSVFEPRGVALLAWAVTVTAFTGLGLIVVETRNLVWRIVFLVGLAAEQFLGGLCMLRLNFWYSTYVVYGDSAAQANAADLGIIAAGVGVAVYAVVFVGLLVLIPKDSPLNVLTRSWVSFILFYAIETVALLIVLFGGLLTVV